VIYLGIMNRFNLDFIKSRGLTLYSLYCIVNVNQYSGKKMLMLFKKKNMVIILHEVYKGHFPGQTGRVDEMGECGTTQVGLGRPLVNGREKVNI